MTRYRRAKVPGGTYFFTVVTYGRKPLFASENARKLLRKAFDATRERHPFETVAMCLLPDHLHAIWTLPQGDADFSRRWAQIKGIFTREFQNSLRVGQGPPYSGASSNVGQGPPCPGASRRRRREGAVWQRRFWEHVIHNEDDLRRHVDYVHYNPVKHGLVSCLADWSWSTFERYVAEGQYETDWGGDGTAVPDIDFDAE